MAVLDAAVLLISAAEGVNAQVRLIWSMLAHYRVPAFIFVNKMDQAEAIGEGEARRALVLQEIRDHLSPYAVLLPDGSGGSFPDPETEELLALAAEDEDLIEQVLEGGHVPPDTVRKLIRGRQIVPVCFGSALKDDGVRELLYTLDRYLDAPDYSASPETPFSARVIKILRDKAGERETWMKLTGGTLRVRDPVTYTPRTPLAEPGKDDEDDE